ncbi:MAG TPA: RNA-binding protein [Candidatus Latescibacteria bacterium]|jgi:RNA recognition motif-containing protein|nr:RNA-binding protein [Candidatus Latescibacterota bacterium]|tara:strand:- start:1819 stop:2082 length:264 start_codon:yes stop_codon:yes gene_type:complete
MRLAIDNLASEATEDDLRDLFEIFGKVSAVEIQRTRGRGLVDMPSKSAAKEAITNLDSQELLGHQISLSEFTQGKRTYRPPRRRKKR